ncbi:dnaJ homolog subfamily C member 2 isoform X2 [Anopheles ziemanni]|uniref:dnaJ homolog subfamily C member 2 isoform X2 n=1 Tax=Anopheles coustani TaxID=139045 RepID=UPI0026584D28|nr:dnaJ homolog subfamily C member 2 isoform X2 [Anopheles coustani]XP_058168138.1 dnaJ homolog subfamily C member 2 isoform X2 [Anopheles ziemanni]
MAASDSSKRPSPSVLTVALRTNYDVRRSTIGAKWSDGVEYLQYLHETQPIHPTCPPTKDELIASGQLPDPATTAVVDPEALFEELFSVDIDYLKSLDPKDWKNQDHYAVLGLKRMRFTATDEDIKRAYRKIVLKHHPDKRKGLGEEVKQDDDYFHCITMAYETLGTLKNRRAFDSIDPEFDDTLPTQSEVEKDFYGSLRDVFKRNARWNESRKEAPQLGDDNTPRERVDDFYDFWYSFQSWREYSYLDEEDKEKGQDREERRWIEKQNKAIRLKRKKEESARIRSLVDLAYNNDPRVVRFKREEKERKLAAKRAKQNAYQAQKAEEERVAKEAAAAKAKAEEAEQKRIELIQVERERTKKILKKERKLLRDTAKGKDYYAKDDKERLKHLEGVEKMVESFKLLELQEFNKELVAGGRDVFVKALDELEVKLEAERMATVRTTASSETIPNNTGLKVVNRKAMWSHDNVQLLIKAVNLFPAGTISRWDVIANYLNQHGTGLGDLKFYAKDILSKAKELQSGDFSKSDLKTMVNQQAYESFERTKKDLKIIDNSEISTKEAEAEAAANKAKANAKQNGNSGGKPEPMVNGTGGAKHGVTAEAEGKPAATTGGKKEKEANRVWSKEEQALLEQAIKTYPVSCGPDRWDRIAECIPNRTKKDCMRRVKELVDLVNAKREAQQAVK